jgi:hypothetical protein
MGNMIIKTVSRDRSKIVLEQTYRRRRRGLKQGIFLVATGLKKPVAVLDQVRLNLSPATANVRYWHTADIATVLIHVRFWG